jgi:hypothetical protein
MAPLLHALSMATAGQGAHPAAGQLANMQQITKLAPPECSLSTLDSLVRAR